MGPKNGTRQAARNGFLDTAAFMLQGGKSPWKESLPSPEHLAYLAFLLLHRSVPEGRHEPVSSRRLYLQWLFPEETWPMFRAAGCPYEATERNRIRCSSSPLYDFMEASGMIPDTDSEPFPNNRENQILEANLRKAVARVDRNYGKGDAAGMRVWDYLARKTSLGNSDSDISAVPTERDMESIPGLRLPPKGGFLPGFMTRDYHEGFVYACVETNLDGSPNWESGKMKVGWSKKPGKRQSALRISNPGLSQYALCSGSKQMEQLFHFFLSPYRVYFPMAQSHPREVFWAGPARKVVDNLVSLRYPSRLDEESAERYMAEPSLA